MLTTFRVAVQNHTFIFRAVFLLLLSTGVTLCCAPSEWTCSNGKCIEAHQLCDGHTDCPDSSDETIASCIATRCPRYAFRCAYGACVSRRAECDGVRDCVDNSDELTANCERKTITGSNCGRDQFACSSGECIPVHMKCDGRADCADGSDEVVEVCAGTYCPRYGFRCGYGACVHGSARCNNVTDCVDGSDENGALCGYTTAVATTTTTTPEPNTDPQSTSCSSVSPINGQVFLQSSSVVLANGSLVEEFASVVYGCRPGWNLHGTNTNFCVSGSWSFQPPSCLKFCTSKSIISESTIVNCEYKGTAIQCDLPLLPETIARISCAFGYRRVADDRSDIAVCGEDGFWDRTVLQCEQICGMVPDDGVVYNIGGAGELKNNTEVPWHAGVYNDLGGRDKYVQICGGTILTNRVVISAAHCFYDKSEGRFHASAHFMVVVGKYYRDWNADEPLQIQKIGVQEIVSVDGYQDYSGLYEKDMVLLVLSDTIVFHSYVLPICMEYNLANNELFVQPGLPGRVAGWGRTVSGGTSSLELKVLDLPTIELSTCITSVPQTFRRFVNGDKFCAGFTTGQSVCQGDSGGGFVVPKRVNGDKLYYLRGIVSSGAESELICDSNKYSVFTNVHFYSSFISSIVHRSDTRF